MKETECPSSPLRILSSSNRKECKVSIIIPVHNAGPYIAECLNSVLQQTDFTLKDVELVIHDDGSNDDSYPNILEAKPRLETSLGRVILSSGVGPTGVGSSRNRACELATGSIFLFSDADDVLNPTRLRRSVDAVESNPEALVGGNFERIPYDATPRYTQYHVKELRTENLEVFAFRDAPLAMPTLACHRKVYDRIGGFREGRGIPEDLHFCYDHMLNGGRFIKLDGEPLVKYRYHDSMVSHSLHRRTLLRVRVAAFEKLILQKKWKGKQFCIWGAGRDGKHVFSALSESGREQVRAFLDVDPRKIGRVLHGKQILHFTQHDIETPLVTAVALNRTNGKFEANLASLNLAIGNNCIPLI